MITAEGLAHLLPDYLVRQRWFGTEHTIEQIDVAAFEVVRGEWPGLAWGLVDVTVDGGEVLRYQLFVGFRSVDSYQPFLDGKGRWLLGDVTTELGEALAYDAFVDPELSLVVLGMAAPELTATNVRPLMVEQSNTSVVFDDRWILKVFRRIDPGRNPDAEITEALYTVGFSHVPPTVASWRRDGHDLAVVRRFLPDASDGFVLAQTSLRDLYDSRLSPERAGGDFAPEARRLGQVTAELHVALAEALGVHPADVAAWSDSIDRDVARADVSGGGNGNGDGDVQASLDAVVSAMRGVDDPGAAIRVHGDLHLGQTIRTDAGWFVLDFEGEPARPLAARAAPCSPLRDVAGMLRSFDYAARVTLAERGPEPDGELELLASEWEARSRAAYLDGYLDDRRLAPLIPGDPDDRRALLDAFELGKAAYELSYERRHRPELVSVPEQALLRIAGVGP